ncbi:MAG: ferrous iron transport protein B [Clostridiaceae bacterium]
MIIALLGNPNVGKSTLFNYLTGMNQYVGNWPGVTVEKKEGWYGDIKVVDLPGIYAMDTYSNEEKVSKNFLLQEKPDLIINIIDASNLSRNLYLTSQAAGFGIPMVIALNMNDMATAKGITIDPDKLSQSLGVPVVPIIAAKGQGVDELVKIIKNPDAHRKSTLKTLGSEKETYAYIDAIVEGSQSRLTGKTSLTERIDRVVLNPILAYPIFLFLLFLVFKLTFSWVGDPLSGAFEEFIITPFSNFIAGLLVNSSSWFRSLVVDGAVAGVGSVIVFLPIIMTLFFGISLLEESGYMSRAALIMDRLMRRMGLSGKAFIPMIIGFGCSVPAIMSARTLESDKDRKLAALLAPLMSCNARLPVYMLFTSLFFVDHQELVVLSLYLLGIAIAFLIGILFKNTIFKKEEEPLLIELPDYQIPRMSSVLNHTWDKGKGFIKKAGTIIFSLSVIVWFLSNFNFSGMVEISNSILASIGRLAAPVLSPLGFGTWQASVSLIAGLMAKEVVISTMEIVYQGDLVNILPTVFNPLSGYAFMVFVLLYTPCVAVMATFKKEFGTKLMLFSVTYQLILAWTVSFLVYQGGRIFLS